MTFSPLISGTVPHHNKFSSRGGRPVTRLIQHHWAGVGGGIERMSDPNQQASCTYIITTDGRILGHVPEEYRPWTSGSAEADAPSITIEVQNTGGQVNGNDSDPASWPISDAAYGAIIRLLVDVAQRHGWPAIDANTYVGHRQFYSTACPGGFLWARMDQTRQLAQQAFTGGLTLQSISITSEEDDVKNEPIELQEAVQTVLRDNPLVIGGRSVAAGVNQALLGIDVVNDNISQLKAFIAQRLEPDAGVKSESEGTFYFKGTDKPEVYALDAATGNVRHVQSAEFDIVQAINLYKEVDQAKVDALLGRGK